MTTSPWLRKPRPNCICVVLPVAPLSPEVDIEFGVTEPKGVHTWRSVTGDTCWMVPQTPLHTGRGDAWASASPLPSNRVNRAASRTRMVVTPEWR
jgi:hypothetical protein